MPEPDRIIKERYRIVRLIGRGGMGDVYEVVDELLGLTYALKQLKIDFEANPDILKRFQDEAKRMLRLVQMNHPNIVQVYHYDFERGFGRYLVMELIRGGDLGQYVRAHGRLPLPEVVRIGKAVASALGRAHDEGLVHRDIKPANILIDESDRKRLLRPVVTDFGIAKDLAESGDDTMTGTGVFIGTSRYAAPEQIRNERGVRIDHRADLYSLGAVLYEMYSGVRYLDELSPQQIMVSVGFDKDWRPPLQYPEPPPAAFGELILHCLERDRDRRTPTAADVERCLDECLQGSVAPARPAAASPPASPLARDQEATPTPLAAEASPTAATVIPEPEDSTAAVRRQAEDRERARYAELIQGLRPEVDERLADWRRLIGELAAFNIVATDTQRLPDLDDRLRAIDELQEQGELPATLANLEALNDRLGQARAEIVGALREVVAKAIADRRAQLQGLREAGGDWVPAAEATRIERSLRGGEDALVRNDWTTCRTSLTDVGGLLERAQAAARQVADASIGRLLAELRTATRELRAHAEDEGNRAQADTDALAGELAAELNAGHLRLAERRAQEALAGVRGALDRVLRTEQERAARLRADLDQLLKESDLATWQTLAADETRRAADLKARAEQADGGGDHRAAAALYTQAIETYGAAQLRAAAQHGRLLEAAQEQLAALLARAAGAPAPVIEAAQRAAEHALQGAPRQAPAAAVEALRSAHAGLAAALEVDVPLFAAATEKQALAQTRRSTIASVNPTPAQLQPIERVLRDAAAEMTARRWRQAGDAYDRAVSLLEALTRDVEQQRARATADAARQRLEAVRAQLDLDAARSLAGDELARAAEAHAAAQAAEQRGDYTEAAERYAATATLYEAVQQRVATQQTAQREQLAREVAALVARAATAPAPVVAEARRLAEAALKEIGAQTPSAALAALQGAHARLTAALADAEASAQASAARTAADDARRSAMALQPAAPQTAAPEKLLRDAVAAFERQQWARARDGFDGAREAFAALAATLHRQREQERSATARSAMDAALSGLDLDIARRIAPSDLAQSDAARSTAKRAEQRQAFAEAAAAYAEAAEGFTALRARVREHLSTETERARRDLAAGLERAPKTPAPVMDAPRAAAQRLLGTAPGEDLAAHLAALEAVRTELATASEEAPLAQGATEEQSRAQVAHRRLLEHPLSRRQRREADALLATAGSAFEQRQWATARDAYARAAGALARLEEAPLPKTGSNAIWATGAGVAALLVTAVALWRLEIGPFAPSPTVAPVAPAVAPPAPVAAPKAPEAPPAVAALARITAFTPSTETVSMRENDTQSFTVAVAPADPLPPIRWVLDEREIARDTASWEYRPDYDAGGAHALQVIVADGAEGTQMRNWAVRVENVNRAPLLKNAGHRPDSTIEAKVGDSVVLDVAMEDPDGDLLTYAWQVDGKPAGANTPELRLKVAGAHAIALRATDGTDTFNASWQVAAAKLPPLKLDFSPKTLERLTFKQSQDFALIAPRDVPATSLTYAWTVDDRAVASDRTFRFVADDAKLVRDKPIVVRASVRDQQGRNFSRDWTVSIVPPAPAITGSTPSERTLDAAGKQTFTLAAAPPVGNQKLTYIFEVDGAAARSAEPGFTYTPSGDGDHSVVAYVEDNYRQRSRDRVAWTLQASSIVAKAEAWLTEYEQALRRKDADAIARLRGLDAAAVAKLKKALEAQRDLRVTLSGMKVDRVDGNRARASYKRVDTWVGPDGRAVAPQSQSCEHTFTLTGGRLEATTRCSLTSGG